MTLYRCDVCNVFEYDSEQGEPVSHILPGTQPENFPADWACPVCNSDSVHLIPLPSPAAILSPDTCPSCGSPLPARVLSPADTKVSAGDRTRAGSGLPHDGQVSGDRMAAGDGNGIRCTESELQTGHAQSAGKFSGCVPVSYTHL